VVSIYEVKKEDWHQLLIDYLQYGKLPIDISDKAESNEERPVLYVIILHQSFAVASG